MDRISVIILIYNHQQYLFRLLDSIFCQTYGNIEIIVTDDGSTKFDEAAIKNYIYCHKNNNIQSVKVLHEEKNVGTVKNINRGLCNASGDFIKIVAGDDFFPSSDVFQTQVEFLKKNKEIMLVTGNLLDCEETTESIVNTYGSTMANKLKYHVYGLPKENRYKYCFKKKIFPYATQSMCFRREFFNRYGYYDERYQLIEDMPMSIRIIDKDLRIGIVAKDAIVHRLGTGVSSTRSYFKSSNIRYYEDSELLFNDLLRKEREIQWKIIYFDYKNIQRYRIRMANTDVFTKKILWTMVYLPFLAMYSILNYDVFLTKLRYFIKSIY